MSDKKFAIETEADIGKGFETLDGELGDLKKKTDDLVAKIEASENVIDDVAELGKDLKTLREDFAKASSKLVTRDGYAATSLPCSKAEFQRAGMEAIYGAKTQFHVNDKRQIEVDNGDPWAELQKAGDELLLVATAMSAAHKKKVHPEDTKYFAEKFAPRREKALGILKAAIDIDTGGPGIGDWIPTGMSTQVEMLISMQLRTLATIRTLPMPRTPFEFPREVARPTFYYKNAEETVAPPAARTAAQPEHRPDAYGTTDWVGTVTFTGRELHGLATVSEWAEEDSIIALVPFVQAAMTRQAARTMEDAFINGDRTGTHMDSDVTSTQDHRKMFSGLRYFGLQNTTSRVDASGSTLSSDAEWGLQVRDLIAGMGESAESPADLVQLVGFRVFNKILAIPGYRTLNVFGTNATNLGVDQQVGFRPDGHTLIVSPFARENLNAAGVYDGITTNLGTSLIYNRNAWARGEIRGLNLRVYDDSYFGLWGQRGIQLTWRGDIQAINDPTASSQLHTVIAYDSGT